MRKMLLAALAWPIIGVSQEVRPVESADYLALIRGDTSPVKNIDSTNNMRRATLRIDDSYFSAWQTIGRIEIRNNRLTLYPHQKKYIGFGGQAVLNTEWQFAGKEPGLQDKYSQGRSMNGELKWRGQETGEVFSYGPSLSTLEFDGSNYAWDRNGRLVPAGTGNGEQAIAYNNNILRNGFLFAPSVSLYGRYYSDNITHARLTLRAGKRDGQTTLSGNQQRSTYFSTQAGGTIRKWEFNGQQNYREQTLTYPNRHGFLHRFYQQSLLCAPSFDGRQYWIDAAKTEDHRYREEENSLSFSAEYSGPKYIKLKVIPSSNNFHRNSRENYRNGTPFFPAGQDLVRDSRDKNFTLNSSIQNIYPMRIGDELRLGIAASSVYNDQRTSVSYDKQGKFYEYQRRSHDLSFAVSPEFYPRNFNFGITLGNKIYSSSTTGSTAFLPMLSGFVRYTGIHRTQIRLFGAYQRFNSEPALNYSYAPYLLTELDVANAAAYMPATEVASFSGLSAIRHRETNFGLEVSCPPGFYFTANWFDRVISDEVLPFMDGDLIRLANMVNHRNRGIELQLKQYPFRLGNKNCSLRIRNQLSYTVYRNKVTHVKDGFNGHPLSGFADVHKAVIEGQPLGVIVGNTWLRNEKGQMIIGNDGFPLVNLSLSVIGDPTPDFVIKLNHNLEWKERWELSIDWEWRKGGDVWNGTEAMLDYYGMSAASGALRNTRDYVFNGVNSSGSHNTIPVSFYDPSLPVEQNRWVRYGPAGVAEAYIQKGDYIRLSNASLTFKPKIDKAKEVYKITKQLSFSLYASNILLWSPYKGVDPRQSLYDQANAVGLDFFNLPGVGAVGFSTSFQF